ncbi:MAG: alanine racemase [Solirubrobacterales bacterium]
MAIDQQTLSPRRAVAEIDLAAITANCRSLRSELVGGAGFCAVVKADGYGHGMAEVAGAALAGGAERLAVVTVAEAAQLRERFPDSSILLLAPFEASEADAAIVTAAELTACTLDQVAAITRAAGEAGARTAVHVKLDTGMSRFGAKTEQDAEEVLDAIAADENLSAAGVWTHFATADELDDDFFGAQLARFAAFAERAKSRHPGLLAHAANSAATLRDAASHFDFVRCGIAIYGLDPFHVDAAARGLKPGLSLRSYVASVRTLAAGESAGYGRRFAAEADTTIATVPIGYGDGWRRALSSKADVLIDGQRFPQRGTVSMDSITVDVGDAAVEIGAPVTLIGHDGSASISTEEVAERAGTINYEITCGLTPRTLRDYSPR